MGKKLNKNIFVERSQCVHCGKYDYSKVEYKNNRTKVCIVCHEHGEFWQTPDNHMNGRGCPKCKNEKLSKVKTKTTEEFIRESEKIHGGKYDYSKTEYFGNRKPVLIICPEHGEFLQLPHEHLIGHGCQKCGNHNVTTEDFINKAKKLHGDKYDYSKTVYRDKKTPVIIICKRHGEFCQKPDNHLSGCGCQKCRYSSLEREINKILILENIKFVPQYKIKEEKGLSFDFYLPDNKIAIECQGRQHFEPVKAFGGVDEHKKVIERDERKKEFCNKNGIKLLYYTNIISEKSVGMYKTIDSILNEIKKCF